MSLQPRSLVEKLAGRTRGRTRTRTRGRAVPPSLLRCFAATGAIWLVLLVSPARAHGPAPAVLEVLRVDSEGRPTLMRTSVGLVESRGDGTYGYLCPSLWGGNELARSFALADGSVVVIDAGSLWRSDGTRTRFVRDETLELAFAVRDVATDGDRLFVLARERLGSGLGRSALFALGDAPTFVDDHPTDLALVDGAPLAFTPTPSACDFGGCTALDFDAVDLLALRAVDVDALHLLATTDVRRLLHVERDGGEVHAGPSGERVLGPVRLGERRVAIVDSIAYELDGTTWRALDGTHPWTTLDEVEGHVLASTLEGVFHLDGSLDASTLVFRFVQLGGPREEHEATCTLDWAHFGGESGWVGTRPADAPEGERQTNPPPASTSTSCTASVGARGDASALSFVSLLCLGLALRRRRAASCGPEDVGG